MDCRRSFDVPYSHPVVKPTPIKGVPIHRIRRMSAYSLEGLLEPTMTSTQIIACGGGMNAVRNQATREAPAPVKPQLKSVKVQDKHLVADLSAKLKDLWGPLK